MKRGDSYTPLSDLTAPESEVGGGRTSLPPLTKGSPRNNYQFFGVMV